MGRINQDIVEYAFSSKSTLSYEMNILLGNDSVYYMVNDAQLNVLVLRSFHFDHRAGSSLALNLKDIFFDDPFLKETYRVTRIVVATPDFTLVPNKFYDATKHATYFENLTFAPKDAVFVADTLKDCEFKNIYTVEKQLAALTQSIFPQAKVFNAMTPMILGYQKISEHRIGHQLFANIRDGYVQMCFFDGKNLVFANQFPFKTAQDVAYFTMLVYEQFKLNPENIPLSISGSLTEDSEIFRYLFRYIRHVNFIPAPPYFRFGQQFTGIPPHFYFDLFSIKLCE